jgi:carboxypeptidase Taq
MPDDAAATPLAALRARLAELTDLEMLSHLAAWDQRTLMPPAGSAGRADQMATLSRLHHERATSAEVGAWLDALDAARADLDPLDADVVRLARRDYDRQRLVPNDLAAELAQASAEGQDVWQQARADDDFARFAPALERNVELARAYAACFADDFARPYDALLADFDYGLTYDRVTEVFSELTRELPPLVEELAARPRPRALDVPVAVQEQTVTAVLRRFGVTEESWRVDVSSHPFSTNIGLLDSRITTRYSDGGLESLLAVMHEFGHATYDRQIAPELWRTSLGDGTSFSIHESQSKLWENHVGRHPAFTPVLAAELTAAGFVVSGEEVFASVTAVAPSLIRVSADETTYPLHIVLRFELESALIEGTLAVEDLPAAWNDGMKRLLGVDVPSDADGVLQDVHWSSGAFGYFPSYALGCLIAAQLWETLESEAGPQADALGAGDVAAIRDWLGTKVHRHGRRLDTVPLVESATGRGLESGPFLRHLASRR